MKNWIAALFYLLAPLTFAQAEAFDIRAEITLAQTFVDDLYRNKKTIPHPILIFDRDEIEWRFLQAQAWDKDMKPSALI